MLKVTTSHLKSARLHKRFEQNLKTFPFAFISVLPDSHLEVESLNPESQMADDDDKVEYRYRGIGIEFMNDIPSVLFSIHSEHHNTLLDSVEGSLKVMGADNQFTDIVERLKELDDPGSSEVVTVVLLSVEERGDEPMSLYKFVAGDLQDDPEDFGENWILCKVTFTNDKIHGVIKQSCRERFLSKLDEKLMEKWEEESLLFVVTAAAPTLVESGLYEFQTIEADTQRRGSITERMVFAYRHPSNQQISFNVYEPASPADVDARTGDGSRAPCRFSMAQANPQQPVQGSQVGLNSM